MMIGDGILTPAISVLSATGGIKVSSPKMSRDIVVVMSIVILTGTEAPYADIPVTSDTASLSLCFLVFFYRTADKLRIS